MASIWCMRNQFRKWSRNPRIWMLFLLAASFMSNGFALSIREFCRQYDVCCSIWLFPLGVAMGNRRRWISLLPILLFCDAPFLDEQEPFLIIRLGRRKWAVGQILYILSSSAVFYLSCFIMTALLLTPYLEWNLDWGKVIYTLTQVHLGFDFHMDPIPKSVLAAYTPVRAFILCGAGTWFAASFLGLVIFLCNLWTRREAGVMVAGAIVLVNRLIGMLAWLNPDWLRVSYIFPTAWMDISAIGNGSPQSPSWQWVFLEGSVILILLIVLILLSVRHKAIEVLKSV